MKLRNVGTLPTVPEVNDLIHRHKSRVQFRSYLRNSISRRTVRHRLHLGTPRVSSPGCAFYFYTGACLPTIDAFFLPVNTYVSHLLDSTWCQSTRKKRFSFPNGLDRPGQVIGRHSSNRENVALRAHTAIKYNNVVEPFVGPRAFLPGPDRPL